jgi:prolyl oligopeptidase
MKENLDAEGKVILDPNAWDELDTLSGFYPSPDCSWAAFGTAHAGDENPVIQVMNLDTLEIEPDALAGWKQRGVSWKHDNSGFFYAANPLEGEVPEGEHFYWYRVFFHKLGTTAEEDELFFYDDDQKELFHRAGVSENGRYLTMSKSMFNKNEMWIQDLHQGGEAQELVTGMDSEYSVDIVDDTILIQTDWQAPNYRVMATSADKPGRENWRELIPESEDVLSYISPVGGKLYAVYQHNAATKIKVFELDGTFLQDIELPTIGSAGVSGYWSKPNVWVSFSSFAHPSTVYTYDVTTNVLTLYKESPVDIDVSNVVVDQVWYPSRDGTEVSMFIVHDKDMPRDGSVPFLLYGYGGFNISMRPGFSTLYPVWIEAGGAVAIANLRGGGEYGREWHEAGMRANKQNVFDDFIAAADWLVENQYTTAQKIAIRGGSNGGLLVSAVITQRPDLCGAVLCQVPLTDMIRFHLFGLANIWSEEYGNAEDPEMFEYLLDYSPYHNVSKGADYPAILVVGSDNDARTDPAHARKFAAAVRWADADNGSKQPIHFFLQSDSGHGGAVTIDQQADMTSRQFAFLMEALGMTAPADS